MALALPAPARGGPSISGKRRAWTSNYPTVADAVIETHSKAVSKVLQKTDLYGLLTVSQKMDMRSAYAQSLLKETGL